MERLSLIDVASEDDLLTSSPCDGFIGQISPVIVGSEESGNQVKINKQIEQALNLSESPEHNKTKTGKCNLRKSLAWDSAFFTSEGVLNHEELAIVNSTFKKTEACSLPIILEDPRKSTESTSTLDNDSWALENLEVDLFENVRASIQMTFGTGEKALTVAQPIKKNNPARRASMKLEPSSRNKKSTPVASERHGVSNHLHESTTRAATVVTNVGADGVTNSKMLKPPRVLSRGTLPAVPTKINLVSGNNQIKTSGKKDIPGNAATQKSAVVSKKTKGGSCDTIKSSHSPKPTPKLVDNSRDTARKSPSETTRSRSTSRAINRSLSGSVTNKASMRTSGSKISRNTSNSAVSPNSSVKLSSIASPSSSFDSVASGSSSSTFSAVKPLIDSVEHGADNEEVHSPGLHSNLGSEDIGHSNGLHVTKVHPKSCPNDSSGTKCYKPSGLKMPTPKIGYFDAKKSLACDVKTVSEPRQQPSFPKPTTGVPKSDSGSKTKPRKIQHVTPANQDMSIDSYSPRSRSTALSRSPIAESPSLERPPKLVVSGGLTDTSEAQKESSPIVKDFHSPFKVFDASVVNKAECDLLPKPSTKERDADPYPKHAANIPVEDEAMILIDGSSGVLWKHSETQATENQNNYHCDPPTINVEKENMSPAK
ncbi:hypothetical protein MUK42_25454 [Musa troglodytarum]|uniref:Uncharacterized protein n=1 Tax=Musa troglodytarum TaxID=320322 RepID=A0A9E7IF38_9LILI|nr:hypothetical protein MUK42_25454 [Musa troglodytarum]